MISDMMEIFISWSGVRSKQIAFAISDLISLIIQDIKPWMSEMDIEKGDRWSGAIFDKLSSCNVGIICVTPENTDSPWLLFETGAISKALGKSKVCPILLGITPSELIGPLGQFQSTTFVKNDIWKLILSLYNYLPEKKLDKEKIKKIFNKFWLDFEKKIIKISEIEIESHNLKTVINALDGNGFPIPQKCNIIYFKEGFESHKLYETAFSIGTRRILIFGRKNRKIFDKDHFDFFSNLREKKSNGLDFRCLFLDPNAPQYILENAHQDKNFKDQLNSSLNNAVIVLTKFNIAVDDVCRVYSTSRNFAIVIIDNTILFSKIDFDETGHAKSLTKKGFELVDVKDPVGKEMLNLFEETWSNSELIG